MKTIKINLPKNQTTIRIKPIADIHLGDPHLNVQKLMEDILEIQKDPYTYTILNGDLINNAIKTSVSDCYGEKMSPMEQLEMAKNLFEPIKDKILAITNGNHENRTYKNDGIDLLHIFAQELGIKNRYSKESAYIFLRLGTDDHRKKQQLCYTIFVNHGSGGGKKEGAKAIRLCDMASIVDADIYIHSHTHLPMVIKENYFRAFTNKNVVTEVEKLFVNTASYLTYGGYGETYEFKPSSNSSPMIYLCGFRKDFTARL